MLAIAVVAVGSRQSSQPPIQHSRKTHIADLSWGSLTVFRPPSTPGYCPGMSENPMMRWSIAAAIPDTVWDALETFRIQRRMRKACDKQQQTDSQASLSIRWLRVR